MSNTRVADPITLNGRVYFDVKNAGEAVMHSTSIDSTGSYRFIIALVGADLQTQDPTSIVAYNGKISPVPQESGVLLQQCSLSQSALTSWFTIYSALETLMPSKAYDLCRILGFIVKDCPDDLVPAIGSDLLTQAGDLMPYLADFDPMYFNGSRYQCAVKLPSGDISYPVKWAQSWEPIEVMSPLFPEFAGIKNNMYSLFFGGLMKDLKVLTDNYYSQFTFTLADAASDKYIDFNIVLWNPYYV